MDRIIKSNLKKMMENELKNIHHRQLTFAISNAIC